MFCPVYGTQNHESATYCRVCGHRLSPGGVPAPRPRRAVPIAVIAVSCVVAVVSVALIVMHLLGSPTQDTSNNMALCANGLARKDGYDYFFVEADQAICRARTDGGPKASEHVLDIAQGTFVNDIAISGDQIFYLTNRYQTENAGELVTASLDGSGAQSTLMTAAGVAQGAESVGLTDLAVFGNRVYLRRMTYSPDSWERRNEVLSMNADGSDLRVEGSFVGKDASVYATLLTQDKLYYAAASDSTGQSTTCSIYVQNLDGSDFRQIYQSDVGIIYHIGISGDRLVFDESNYTVQKTVVTTTKLDGTDVRRLYTAPTDAQAKLAAVADGRAYVLQTDSSAGLDTPVVTILSAPLSGVDTAQVWRSTSLQSVELAAAGDHLVVFENSYASYGTHGDIVFAIDCDGAWLGTYAVSPYGEPKLEGSGLPLQQASGA